MPERGRIRYRRQLDAADRASHKMRRAKGRGSRQDNATHVGPCQRRDQKRQTRGERLTKRSVAIRSDDRADLCALSSKCWKA